MPDTLLTHLQIFGIGFSFGMAGPCLATCAPVLITFILGRRERLFSTAGDILVFSAGRIVAYALLGAAAGLSGSILRRLTDESIVGSYINPIAGAISILLGCVILTSRDGSRCECVSAAQKAYSFGGLLTLGFVIGLSPCGPLAALMLEIAMISKSAAEGALYAFSFGIGTMIASVIAVGAIAGIAGGLINRFVKSGKAAGIFRKACAVLLIVLGIWLISTGFHFKAS